MKRKTGPRRSAPPPAFMPPYPPGWFDRLFAAVDRLPGPTWLWYALFAILIFLLISLARWAYGLAPFGGDLGFRAFSAVMFALPAFLAHDLNRVAVRSFDTFAPALSTPGEADRLRYQLTTAPAVPSLVFSLGGAVLGALLLQAAPEMGPILEEVFGPPAITLSFGALSWFVNSHFAYRVTYQLVWVSRIYARHARVDLSDLKPIFAFSGLASRAATASILVVTGYGIGWSPAGDLALSAAIVLPNLSLALAAFVLPLRAAHRLLVLARGERLREVGGQIDRATDSLHQAVASGRYRQVPPIKDALTALDLERIRFERLPTWPWAPGTLRGVAATVFLPIAIWLIQFGLGRMLG